jgi:hypothetical protein
LAGAGILRWSTNVGGLDDCFGGLPQCNGLRIKTVRRGTTLYIVLMLTHITNLRNHTTSLQLQLGDCMSLCFALRTCGRMAMTKGAHTRLRPLTPRTVHGAPGNHPTPCIVADNLGELLL